MLYAVHPAVRAAGTGTAGGGQPMAGREMATEVESSADGSDELTVAETAAAEADSLAPAVSRAARILEVLAESNGEPVGPSELARRLGLPKSSIANICGALADAGLVRRIGDRLRPRPAPRRARWRVSGQRRPGPGVLRGIAQPARRLGGDGPVRRARRPRGHLPRAPRWTTARPAELGDRSPAAGRFDRDREGRPGLTPRRRPRSADWQG